MRIILSVIGGAAVGLLIGMILSGFIDMAGTLLFDAKIVTKYFPLYTAAFGAVAMPFIDLKKEEA